MPSRQTTPTDRLAVPAPSRKKADDKNLSSVPQAQQAPRWLHSLIVVLTALLLISWFSRATGDNDAWWQLKTGQYIWQNHRLPVPDPFAFTTYIGKPAYAGEFRTRDFNLTHSWLSQVFFYGAYAAGGFAGLVLFRAALLTLFCGITGLVAWHRSRNFFLAVGAAIATGTIAEKFAADRPFVVTAVFVAATLAILEYRRWLWALPPVFLVWANCHAAFFLGWVVVGAYCAESLYLRWRGKPIAGERRLWMVAVASILASGLNPNLFNAIPVTIAYRQSLLQRSLWEWQHTALWPPEAFGIVLATATVTLLRAGRSVRPVDWILFCLFAAAAVYIVRNVILMALIGPILIAAYFPWKVALPRAGEWLAAGAILAGTSVGVAQGSAFQLRANDWKFPSGAADFLLEHHVSAPMFNTYEDGGYLMWRLWPQERVFIDGRALNESVFQDFRRIAHNADATGGESAEALLEKYGIEVIVMGGFEYLSGSVYYLPAALADPNQTEWRLAFQDAHGLVFMRHPPADVAVLNGLDALTSMEAQCAEHLHHDPVHPGCAAGLADLFKRIGDQNRAGQWSRIAAVNR